MRLGVRAHDFGRLPADELAQRIAAKGLSCVQLALGKAIAGLETVQGRLNPGLAFEIGQAFARRGIQIAVLGCYVNPIHPDRALRKTLLGLFREHLRYARDFGCSLVALETGSVNADYAPHPDNADPAAFHESVNSIAELVQEAQRFGVLVGIEAVTGHVVSTPAKMRRVLDAVRSDNLQVVMDPVNLLSIENYREQDRLMQEAFDLYGERIVAIHAKDFVVEGGALRAVRAGLGQFHHKYLFDWIEKHKPSISVLLEETNEATVEESARFLRGVAGGP